MENNVLLEKSLAFAARIVKVYRYLSEQQHETVLSQQLLRSGTSIGANANEAVYAVSSTASKPLVALRSSASDNLQLNNAKKARKYAIFRAFSMPEIA